MVTVMDIDDVGNGDLNSEDNSCTETLPTNKNISHWAELTCKGQVSISDLVQSSYGS